MSSPHPVIDVLAWARWLLAFAAVIVLPGWALVGRHLRGLDLWSRLYLAVAAGLTAVPLCAVPLSALGIPFQAVSFLVVSLGGAWLLGRQAWWRERMGRISEGLEPLGGLTSAIVLGLCAAMAVIIVAAFRDYAAPNHLDDASNHSFMVLRILQTHSVAPSRVFAPPYGAPVIPYVMGWHASAALMADVAGVSAYVSAWYLPIFAAVLMPLALSLFWRACGIGRGALLLAGGFAVANYYTPNNIFSWGGWGAIVGPFLIPWVVLTLRAALRTPDVLGGVIAGLALVALIHVHTGDVFSALVLLIAVARPNGDRALDKRATGATLLVVLGTVVVAGVLPLLGPLRTYRGWVSSEALPSPPGWPAVASQFLTFAGGNVPILHWFVLPGLAAGLLLRGYRRLGLLALAYTALYFGLRQVQDPVSLLLSRPYYRQFPRVIYPLLFMLPPLMAAAVLAVRSGLHRIGDRMPGGPKARRLVDVIGVAVLVIFVFRPGAYWNYRNLEYQKRGVPFSADDYRLARQMTSVLPECAVVANQYGDGSFWAMHASGLRFLDPCSWPLGASQGLCHRPAIGRLLEKPWPPEVRALHDTGVDYVYVGDAVLEGVHPPLRRALLDADPRFARLLDDGNAAVYRIRWDAEPFP